MLSCRQLATFGLFCIRIHMVAPNSACVAEAFGMQPKPAARSTAHPAAAGSPNAPKTIAQSVPGSKANEGVLTTMGAAARGGSWSLAPQVTPAKQTAR